MKEVHEEVKRQGGGTVGIEVMKEVHEEVQ